MMDDREKSIILSKFQILSTKSQRGVGAISKNQDDTLLSSKPQAPNLKPAPTDVGANPNYLNPKS